MRLEGGRAAILIHLLPYREPPSPARCPTSTEKRKVSLSSAGRGFRTALPDTSLNKESGDLGPGDKTPGSQCREPGFDPWSGK